MKHRSKYIDNLPDSFFDKLDVKLCFLDIDGTIVSGFNEISTITIDIIQRIRSLGVHVSLATGRPLFGVKHIIEELNITDPCVLFAGGMIFDPKTSTVIKNNCISKETLEKLINFSRENDLYLELYSSDLHYVEVESHYLSKIHAQYQKVTPKIHNLVEINTAHDIIKAVIVLDLDKVEDSSSIISSTFPEVDFSIGFGGAHPKIKFINIIPKGNLKKNSFVSVLNLLNIRPEQTIAFGDSYSDIVFSKLSHLGIAMENGVDELKEVANIITKSASENGVAYALNRIFNLRNL